MGRLVHGQECPSSSVPPDKSPSAFQGPPQTCLPREALPDFPQQSCSVPALGQHIPMPDTLSRVGDSISFSSVTSAASRGLTQMTHPGRVGGMTQRE